MHKKFEINWTKIKSGCQLGRKVVTHNSKSDLPLAVPDQFRIHVVFNGGGFDINTLPEKWPAARLECKKLHFSVILDL